MNIEDMLSKDTKDKLYNLKQKKQIKKEQLSKQEIAELMGVNRPTYKKVNGKVKQK